MDGLTPRALTTRQPSSSSALIPKQVFSGNPLERAYDTRRRFDGTSMQEEVSLIVVCGREICVRNAIDARAGVQYDLQALLLGASNPELDLNSDSICLNWLNGENEQQLQYQLPLYLLGQDSTGRWTFALDVTGCKEQFVAFLKEACQLEVMVQDLRALMPGLSQDACAIAGQAVALSQWHQMHKFCPRCGNPTAPIETGLRRACTTDSSHKLYPRTDPVVIMLVESPDGRRVLLGRNKKFTPGMYTCLSGFIDQCESIEEAVRREVMEEARVVVDEVAVVGSQPWPIGRYGSCELMLGCIAQAKSYEIIANTREMEDVQWYEKDELAAAVRIYDSEEGASVAELQELSMEQLGFFVPPPLAIAHHLIRLWALHEGPWFKPAPAASKASSHGPGSEPGFSKI